MLITFSISWYNRTFHWKGNNPITNGRNFYHGISTNTQMLQFWHHGSRQKRDFRAQFIQVQSCLPLTVKLFFLSLLQSWMVSYLFHGPLHTITSYDTPTNMGASSKEPGDTITQVWDFYNNLLNQTIKIYKNKTRFCTLPTTFV